MATNLEKLLKSPENLAELLLRHPGKILAKQTQTLASVLLVLQPQAAGTEIWFIRKSPRLRRHAGQIAFPGGKTDPEDAGRWETAVREAYEEIGLEPDGLLQLGTLNELSTPTGFQILPFVAWNSGPAPIPVPNEEVEMAFSMPLIELIDSEIAGMWPSYPSPHGTIWGATGKILNDYFRLIMQASGVKQGSSGDLFLPRSQT